MTDGPTDIEVNYILDAHWYRKSLQKSEAYLEYHLRNPHFAKKNIHSSESKSSCVLRFTLGQVRLGYIGYRV